MVNYTDRDFEPTRVNDIRRALQQSPTQPTVQDEPYYQHDLVVAGDITITGLNIDGTTTVIIKGSSSSSNTFNVNLDWVDANGNVLYQERPAASQGTTSVDLNYNVASSYVDITITDTSGAANNVVSFAINAH